MQGNKLVYRALKTPDGTILPSFYRHDYREHLDKNGNIYMIDGGLDYCRSSSNGDEEFIEKFADLPYKELRNWIHWGASKNIDKTEWIPLKHLNLPHLEYLIEKKMGSDFYKLMFIRELQYRMIECEE